jgi:hypothetical protein
VILKCKCEHEFQDKRYGKGLRVHNFRVGKNTWVCTVCLKEKNARDTQTKKEAK